jgi:hypothetical protein
MRERSGEILREAVKEQDQKCQPAENEDIQIPPPAQDRGRFGIVNIVLNLGAEETH